MSGPVLVFRGKPKPRRQQPQPKWSAEALEAAKVFDSFDGGEPTRRMMLHLIGGPDWRDLPPSEPPTSKPRNRVQRPRNIGKPVITIDRDDREGA